MSTKDVTITFVLPTECDTEVETIEVMQNAYKVWYYFYLSTDKINNCTYSFVS